MHNIEQLMRAGHKEQGFPMGEEVTAQYVEAAKVIAQQSKNRGTKFPVIEVSNVVSGQTERVSANAAELIIEGALPITLAPNMSRYDDNGNKLEFVMARLSVLNMILAERVGLDATRAAIQVPPFDRVEHRTLRPLGTWYDDTYFARIAHRQKTVKEIQQQLSGRYGGKSIYRTPDAATHFDVIPLVSRRKAESRLRRELSDKGFKLLRGRHWTGMEEDAPGYSAVAPEERGVPRPIEIANGATLRLAANESLLVLEDSPDKIFGPQEYLLFDTKNGKFETTTY